MTFSSLGPCVLLGGFPCENLLTPAAHRRRDLLCLLVEMSERNKQIHYSVCAIKTSQNPLRYFYSPATSADGLSKFTSHYTEITCTWWVCWLISNSNKKYSCICIMNLCEYIFCNSNTVNAFIKKNSYIFLLFLLRSCNLLDI